MEDVWYLERVLHQRHLEEVSERYTTNLLAWRINSQTYTTLLPSISIKHLLERSPLLSSLRDIVELLDGSGNFSYKMHFKCCVPPLRHISNFRRGTSFMKILMSVLSFREEGTKRTYIWNHGPSRWRFRLIRLSVLRYISHPQSLGDVIIERCQMFVNRTRIDRFWNVSAPINFTMEVRAYAL